MKLHVSVFLAIFVLVSSLSQASISFNIQADKLKNADGTAAMNPNGLVLFVSSTSNLFFDPITAGSLTSVGSSLNGGDDIILFRSNLTTSGFDGVLDIGTGDLSLASIPGWTTGDPLALLWFPTLTLASTTIGAATPYGLYTMAVPIDGSSTWVTPTDGLSAVPLYFFTADGSDYGPGSNPALAGNASLTVGAVPEPSRTLLGLIGLVVVALRRRRC
jgi:hypothetical protein